MKLFSARVALVLSFAIEAYGTWRDHNHGFPELTNRGSILPGHECARPCAQHEPSRTCYYRFTVEYYSTLSNACNSCRQSGKAQVIADCQCIEGDGYEKSGLITVNRMYPGPAIMVCLGDNVVVDVVNLVPGNAITIHWHGVYQRNYPHFDGVPWVTQCPILEGTTFRYQWKAENSGTHFWHAHTGLHKSEGLLGPIVIREPRAFERNSNLWDFDDMDNVIFLTDWFHTSSSDHFPGNIVRQPGQQPDNFLINGMGQWTDPNTGITNNARLATFTVKSGKRYRFRLINGLSLICPVQVTIEGHSLTIIESDGEPYQPFVVDSITTSSAERYDFIINTDKAPGNYWIQLRGLGICARRKIQQFAVLHYEFARAPPVQSPLTYDAGLPTGVLLNPLNTRCYGNDPDTNVVCINNQRHAYPVPPAILKDEPDVKLFLPFGFHRFPPDTIFGPGTYGKYLVINGNSFAGMISNISMVFPTSPLLSQRDQVPNRQICSSSDFRSKCRSALCECIHIEKIPLGSVVEIILVDETRIAGLSHPFHLHGQSFYMLGEGDNIFHGIEYMNTSYAIDLDSRGQLNRHSTFGGPESFDARNSGRQDNRPMWPAKDTFAVPNNGYSIIRFLADNPGYWLFHCHFEFHTLAGMAVIFQVGEPRDVRAPPVGFPKCGQYMPPLIFND